MQERYEQFTQATQQDANLPFDNNDQAPAEFFTAQPSDLSLMDRIAAIFTSPREAMQGIELIPNQAAVWSVSILIAFFLTFSSSVVRYYTTDAVQVEYQQTKERLERMEKKASPEGKQRIQKEIDNLVPQVPPLWMPFLASFFLLIVPFFISGIVFWFIGKYAYGIDSISYGAVLVASSLTYIVSSVGDLINLIIQSITGNSIFTIGPSLLVTQDLKSILFSILIFMGVFKIWDLYLFSTGYSSLLRKQKLVGILIVFGTWILRLIITGGLLYWGSTIF